MYIFEKRVDNIILDLKKRSFQLQQDLSDGEGDKEKKEAAAANKQSQDKAGDHADGNEHS